MEKRRASQEAFYTSDTWFEYRPGVLGMLIDARHVHLLEPIDESLAFDDSYDRQSIAGSPYGREDWTEHSGVVVVEAYLVDDSEEMERLVELVRGDIAPLHETAGGTTQGIFRTSQEENNYPRLPVIEDELLVVWIGSYESSEIYERSRERASFGEAGPQPYEVFVLAPGARSRMYDRAPQREEAQE
jgi:hypothetical protein